MSEARRVWNKVDIDENFIRENFDKMSAREIGEALGVSRELINHRIRKMGLRKTKIPFIPEDGEMVREIKDAPGYGITNKSRVVNLKEGTLLKPKVDATGYLKVTMFLEGRRVEKRVHRLVAEYFIPNPDGLPIVNHLDGDKTNADISNLEWTTPKGNAIHALEHGLLRIGEEAPTAKITEDEALSIINDISNGMTNREIQEKYPSATKSIVEKLRNKSRWKHLFRSLERATTSREA